MTSTGENRFFYPAWGISLTLHGAVVGLAMMCVTQVKPALPEDVFQWDVTLVEVAKHASLPEPAKSVMPPDQPMAKAVPPSRPRRVTEVAQKVRPLEQQTETPLPMIEPSPPTEQKVEVSQIREEPFEQRIVEVAAPAAEPIVEAKMAEPVAVASAPVSPSVVVAPQEEFVQASEPAHSMETAPAQMTTTSVSGPEMKADHQWLAESLWRRVAELKRYPNLARMNGQEGKVIVKAVIRSDGHLADVFVQKSSGYSALDAAAIEAVRLACPLHMKHAIGKPQIVVSLPIVYSLAN